jgi:hypothetical protein
MAWYNPLEMEEVRPQEDEEATQEEDPSSQGQGRLNGVICRRPKSA